MGDASMSLTDSVALSLDEQQQQQHLQPFDVSHDNSLSLPVSNSGQLGVGLGFSGNNPANFVGSGSVGSIGGLGFSDILAGDLSESLEAQLRSMEDVGIGVGTGTGDLSEFDAQELATLQQRNEAQRSQMMADVLQPAAAQMGVQMGVVGGVGPGGLGTAASAGGLPYNLGQGQPHQQQQQFQQQGTDFALPLQHTPSVEISDASPMGLNGQQHQQPYAGPGQMSVGQMSLFGGHSAAATSSAASPVTHTGGVLLASTPTLQASADVKAEGGLAREGALSGFQSAAELLENLVREQVQLGQRIAELYQSQKLAFRGLQANAGDAAAHAELQSSGVVIPQIRLSLQNLVKSLEDCFSSVVLQPAELQRVLFLRQDLFIQHRQIELLVQELQWWQYTEQKSAQSPSPGGMAQHGQSKVPCLCELVVIRQPFPVITNKNKQLAEDELQVQLLTASATPVASVTQVRAILSAEAGDVTKGTNVAKPLDCDSANIDPATRVAKFSLKFCSGTKKLPAQIKFGMQVSLATDIGQAQTYPVESHFSQPFVAITNEIQWDGSAGVLMKREVFSEGRQEVSWAAFANVLQRHFCLATRQELSHPQRVLSPQDIAFIHAKFFREAPVLTTRDFDQFWSWFGPTMQRVRYQRHMCSLWQQGYVYGFMTREQANAALEGQDPGTFIIRFSERNAGQYVIAYVGATPGQLKNYLVQPNDTAASKRTLPDFIHEQPQFVSLLVLGYNSENEPVFWRLPKQEALAQFVGKTQPKQLDEGYDPL